MKKIPTLFVRDAGTFRVLNAVHADAQWVTAGEGVATRKFDGTACLVVEGRLWKRYESRAGKPVPPKFLPLNAADIDGAFGPGWLPVSEDAPEDQYHREAWDIATWLPDGTYELVGPKIQRNPERFAFHCLVRHGTSPLFDAPRDFDGLRVYLGTHDIEGVVWHHGDGRMVKIKGTDFGIKRAVAVMEAVRVARGVRPAE